MNKLATVLLINVHTVSWTYSLENELVLSGKIVY